MLYFVQYTFSSLTSEDFPDTLLEKLSSYDLDPVIDSAVDEPGLLHLSLAINEDSLFKAHQRTLEILDEVTDKDSPLSADRCSRIVAFAVDQAEVLSQA